MEKKLVALVFIALLTGLGGGYSLGLIPWVKDVLKVTKSDYLSQD